MKLLNNIKDRVGYTGFSNRLLSWESCMGGNVIMAVKPSLNYVPLSIARVVPEEAKKLCGDERILRIRCKQGSTTLFSNRVRGMDDAMYIMLSGILASSMDGQKLDAPKAVAMAKEVLNAPVLIKTRLASRMEGHNSTYMRYGARQFANSGIDGCVKSVGGITSTGFAIGIKTGIPIVNNAFGIDRYLSSISSEFQPLIYLGIRKDYVPILRAIALVNQWDKVDYSKIKLCMDTKVTQRGTRFPNELKLAKKYLIPFFKAVGSEVISFNFDELVTPKFNYGYGTELIQKVVSENVQGMSKYMRITSPTGNNLNAYFNI